MNKDYIPSKDSLFDTFQSTVISYTTPKKVEFGIPDAVITTLTNAQSVWAAIWLICKVKTQRTSQQVVEKGNARKVLELLLRNFIQQYIMLNPAVSDGDREAMQIKPRSTEHTPIPAPETRPHAYGIQDDANQVKIFFKQILPDGETKRGKPDGVQFCEIAYCVNEAPESADECIDKLLSSRSPKLFQFSEAQQGKKLYYYARWVNPKGEVGPWTNLQTVVIP